MLLAAGWVNERIAGAVINPQTGKPISIATLKRHFRAELAPRASARDQLFARQLMAAATEAFKGNVGAMRLLQQLIEKNDMALLDARHRKPDAPADEPPLGDKIGKKARRAMDAQKVPDDYGDIFARRRAGGTLN